MKTVIVFFALLPMTGFTQKSPPPKLLDTSAFIHFEHDKSSLNSASGKQLNAVADFIIRKKATKIVIGGHTDSDGSEAYNIRLSKKRSYTVYSYLARKGVNTKVMAVSSFGEVKPFTKNSSEKGKQRNRRVEIKIQYPGNEMPAIALRDTTYDTTITGAGGVQFRINEGMFGDYKLNELSFQIREAYRPEEMLAQGLATMNTANGCLQSDGMVFLDVKYITKEVEPDGKQKMEVWIPAGSADKEMEVYIPSVDSEGEMKWRKQKNKPEIKTENGKSYYVFETEMEDGWNIDKFTGPCPLTGPRVKTRLAGRQKVFVSSGTSISPGKKEKGKVFKTSDMQVTEEPVVTAVARKKGKTYIAQMELKKMKYNKRRNYYYFGKKDYKIKNCKSDADCYSWKK